MKRALVFSGGGSRGAYEIGAWMALKELGVRFHAVYGASIGAINAALAAQGDEEIAVRLWDNITLRQVVNAPEEENFSIGSMISSKRDIIPFLLSHANQLRMDVGPLENMISENVIEGRVRASGLDLNVTTVRIPSMTPVQISIRDMAPGSLTDWLMASSACFPVFPLRQIQGMRYMDGGYFDNLPIDRAVQDGADEVIAVDVHPDPTHPEYARMPFLTMINPLNPLSGFLEFDPRILVRSRRMGYYDAMKRFGRFEGVRYTFRREGDIAAASRGVRYMRQVALFDARAASRGAFQGRESGLAPLISAISQDRPLQDYTWKDVYLRGLELAMRAWGYREDAVYAPDEVLARLAAQAAAGGDFDVPVTERSLEEVGRRGDAALVGYLFRAFGRGEGATERSVRAMADYPAQTAAALWLHTSRGESA